MELKQLQYFLAVASHLNFRRAAESLYISQPSLSYQITELERELGVELFTRDKRRVTLTPGGAALVEPAREMLRQAGELPDLVKQGGRGGKPSLRVGFDQTEDHFEFIGVPQTLARFAQSVPGIDLMMTRAPFTECADQVIYGDLDLAFLIVRDREHLPPDLTCRPIYRSRVLMVVRKDLPIETCADAVNSLDLLLVEEKPRGNTRILKTLDNMKLTPRIRSVDSITTGFTYTYMGKGIMLMSEIFYKIHAYRDLKAIPIPDPAAEITHVAVWNRSTGNPAVSQLLEQFPEVT